MLRNVALFGAATVVSVTHALKFEVKAAKQTECAICQEDFAPGERVSETQCGHTFHDACLNRWFTQEQNTCPMCRAGGIKDSCVKSTYEAAPEMHASKLKPGDELKQLQVNVRGPTGDVVVEVPSNATVGSLAKLACEKHAVDGDLDHVLSFAGVTQLLPNDKEQEIMKYEEIMSMLLTDAGIGSGALVELVPVWSKWNASDSAFWVKRLQNVIRKQQGSAQIDFSYEAGMKVGWFKLNEVSCIKQEGNIYHSGCLLFDLFDLPKIYSIVQMNHGMLRYIDDKEKNALIVTYNFPSYEPDTNGDYVPVFQNGVARRVATQRYHASLAQRYVADAARFIATNEILSRRPVKTL